MALYSIWFILLLPLSLWTDSGLFKSPLHFLKQLVFNSTFADSWYIMALIIAIPAIYLLSKLMSNRFLIIIGLIGNMLSILVTNHVWTDLGSMIAHHWYMLPIRIYPYQAFIVALFWVAIGKLFADGQIRVNRKQLWRLGFGLSLIGFCLEQFMVLRLRWNGNGDCFFMLIPACLFLFGLVITLRPRRHSGSWLHGFATVTYCLHGSLLRIIINLSFILFHYRIVTNTGHIIEWIILLLGCAGATLLITQMEKLKGFGWLRLAH